MGLGGVLSSTQRFAESLQAVTLAIQSFAEAGSDEAIFAINDSAIAETSLGMYHEAYESYQKCLAFYRARGWPDRQASVLEDLASYWMKRGNLAEARTCCEQALDSLDTKDSGVLRRPLMRQPRAKP